MKELELTRDIDAVVDQFSIDQDYGRYTEQDQDTWRIAMANLEQVLVNNTAVDYVQACQLSGMSSDQIPTLESINDALGKFGWSAIVVAGFIPPDVFMSLQANSILPITRHIRSRHQLGYTPVPDIVHEAAGHLPMLSCSEYRFFLQRLGEIGANTSMNALDMKLYTRQKQLAELLAEDGVDASLVTEAEKAVQEAATEARNSVVSPARRVARFHWWTVEYGLIGDSHDIYGAGLLSSVEEARDFRKVPHLKLSLESCNRSFEIDHVQPQYFVADSWGHLMDEVDALERAVAK